MKFFIDSAIVTEIKECAALGLLDGVTTNPSLIAKSGRKQEDVIREICEIVNGPVSAEVLATEHRAMATEGRRLAKLHPNVVVKLPLIPDGLKATRELTGEGIRVNVTLCFSAIQGLLAMKAGASFLSPFVGRLDDISTDGMEMVADLKVIKDNYNFPTEILVASVRHPVHVLQAARMGADVATIPYATLLQLAKHPLTDMGLEKFLADARKSGAL